MAGYPLVRGVYVAYTAGMQTTIRVSTHTRDRLASVAAEHAITMDEAVKELFFERDCLVAYARLQADPEDFAQYRAEMAALAQVGNEVYEAPE